MLNYNNMDIVFNSNGIVENNHCLKQLSQPITPYKITTSADSISIKYIDDIDLSPTIRKVIFNNPATIVYWEDGTKTVVKCQDGCEYSKYVGFMACVTKKVYGNKGSFNNIVNYWLEHGEDHSNGDASE